MTEVKTIKCETIVKMGKAPCGIPRSAGNLGAGRNLCRSVRKPELWMPVWSDPAEYASGCIEKGKANSGIPSNSSEPGENHGNVYAQ